MGLHQDRNDRPIPGFSTWSIPAVFTLISGLIAITGESGRTVLKYDRIAIEGGEFWRLISGHFAHLSGLHLALNLAGLWLIWFLLGARLSQGAWVATVFVVIAGIDAGFWVLNPYLLWYVGLSGLLHGLIVAGAIAGLKTARTESVVILTGVFAKIVYEQVSGAVPGTEFLSGGPVVTDAHLYGALSGVIAGLLLWHRVGRSASI